MFSSYTERPMIPCVYNVAEVSVSISDRGTLQSVPLSCIPFSVTDCMLEWALLRVLFLSQFLRFAQSLTFLSGK